MNSSKSKELLPPPPPPLPSQEMVRLGQSRASWMLYSVVLIVICLVIAWWAQHKVPPTRYTLVTQKGLVPLEISQTPIFSLQKVQGWSGRAISDIFTFDFKNADEHMNSMRPYFNSAAWSSFIGSIESTNIVKTVKKNSLLVQITPLQDPYVVDAPYMQMGKWVWPRVEVPVLISYIGSLKSNKVPSQKITFVLTLVQVDATDNPDGLQIASMIPTDYKGNQ